MRRGVFVAAASAQLHRRRRRGCPRKSSATRSSPASSITRRGHEIVQGSRARIQARGLEVIYGDTDSLFVHVGQSETSICVRLGTSLATERPAGPSAGPPMGHLAR